MMTKRSKGCQEDWQGHYTELKVEIARMWELSSEAGVKVLPFTIGV